VAGIRKRKVFSDSESVKQKGCIKAEKKREKRMYRLLFDGVKSILFKTVKKKGKRKRLCAE
jgi:hypothetical protein